MKLLARIGLLQPLQEEQSLKGETVFEEESLLDSLELL